MWKRLTLILMTLLLATSCASRNTTSMIDRASVDSSCTLFQPIYTHGNDAQVMDARTVRAINTHNELWDRLCSDKKQ
ncbi:hypothetical protein HA40_05725 [Mixta calida]|nr:hypothetical protein HA40_05725 [Mixta calida]